MTTADIPWVHDRPDLQRLLDDIRSRKLDVIVVYKVDRLTRSLADFAKLVELFDAHGVSFVSVTQSSTHDLNGRLTLNVLLSFAHLRGRSLRAHPRQDRCLQTKGLWVGGPSPRLSHEGRQDAVVEDEAERVRLIYRRYLDSAASTRWYETSGSEISEPNLDCSRPVSPEGVSLRPWVVVLSAAQPLLYR